MSSVHATATPMPRTSPAVWLLGIYALLVGGALATFALRTPENAPLLVPLAILTGCAVMFFAILTARQGGGAPVFQLGGFFGLMAYLYAAYPIVVFLARGQEYGRNNDGRLYAAQPLAAELSVFEWWYVGFFVAFAVLYLALTRRHRGASVSLIPPPRGIVIVIVAAYCGVSLMLTLGQILFPYDIQTYGDAYLAIQRLPTFARQIIGTMNNDVQALLIMITAALFAHYRRRRIWIVLLLGWVSFNTVRALQARSVMFILLFAAAFLYHNLVRRITLAVALAGVLAALGGLAWLGAKRLDDRVVTTEWALGGSSEFEVILANAYDLKYVQHADGALLGRPIIYLSDFAAVFPQQIFPFQKQTKAEWYLATYWPQVAAMGGGYAFGMLSEAVTGFGGVEAVVRGALLGLIFGLLHRRVTARPINFWPLVFYLWLMVMSYHLIRNTTFGLLQWSIYQFVVPMIGIRVTYFLLSHGRQRLRRWRAA